MIETTLQECLKAVIDNRGVTPHKRGTEWQDSGIPVLSANNVKTSGLQKLNEIRYIPEEIYPLWMKTPLERGDIILTSEAPAGEVYYWDSDEKIVLGQRLYGLKVKDWINSKYLKYYLQSSIGQKAINSQQSGSTVFGIAAATFPHIVVKLLNKDEQDAVAELLYAIDSKISNNNAICADLEGMAKLLYDYWFVQFDFPDKNGKPYKSSGGKLVWNDALKREIPEGWEVRQLGEFISVIRGISYKPTDELKVADENSVFLLKSNNIQNGTINFEQPVILSKALASNEQWLTKNSIFITMSSGSKAHMGKTAIVYKDLPYVFGAFCAKIAIQENVRCFVSTYFRSEWFRVYIENVTAGTNINNISNEQLTEILLPIPKDEILKKFENSLIDAFDKLGELIEENRQLISLRDFLLPMLMNGQVKVGKTDA